MGGILSHKNIRNKISKRSFFANIPSYLMAFLLPAIVIIVVMIRLGITPFGDTSVFLWDARLQYKDFYGYLWDVLHGEASIQYSMGKSLGGSMIAIIAYYASSPLNLFLFFFKKSQLSDFMALLIILKVGLSGLTSHFYLKRRFGLSFMPAICFSTAYALMEYNVYYCRNLMWMDGVIMLPLVAYGVWKLINEKKVLPLWIAVAVSIISNWYTGYMVCLFSGLLFLYESFIFYDFHLIREKGKVIRAALSYLGAMLGGVCVSAFLLIPALLNFKSSNTMSGFGGIWNFNILDFFRAFNIDAAGNSQTAPIVYCGALLIFCVVYYFIDEKHSVKEHLLSAAFLFVMILSFCLRDGELLWTLFVHTSTYYFPYSFLFVFLCVLLAGSAFEKVQESGYRNSRFALTEVVLVAGGIVLRELNILSLKEVGLMALGGGFLILTYDMGEKSVWDRISRTAMGVLVVCLTVAELGYNAEYAFRGYSYSDEVYASYEEGMEEIIDEINDTEEDFYRLEKTISYLSETDSSVASDEALLFGYNSIEHYSMSNESSSDVFLSKVGYADWVTENVFTKETYWNSSNIVMDSLLAVKYTITDKESYGYETVEISAKLPDDSYSLYVNKYALSLGYNIATDSEEEISWTDDPYRNQELFLSALTGEDVSLYCYMKGERIDESRFESEDSDEESLTEESAETEMDGEENQSETAREDDDIFEYWEFTAESDGPVFLYVDGTEVHWNYYVNNCVLYVNGEMLQKICTRFMINSVYLGEYEAGDVIEVEIEHVNKNCTADHTLYMAQLDTETFEKYVSELGENSESHLTANKNQIEGIYETAEDTVMFLSIPYEDGWTAWVDGEKTEIKNILGTFIGLELTAGEHEVLLEYTTPGWNTGCALTLIGVIALAVTVGLQELKRRKNSLEKGKQERG